MGFCCVFVVVCVLVLNIEPPVVARCVFFVDVLRENGRKKVDDSLFHLFSSFVSLEPAWEKTSKTKVTFTIPATRSSREISETGGA